MEKRALMSYVSRKVPDQLAHLADQLAHPADQHAHPAV